MGVPILYQGSQYFPGIPPSKQYPAFSSAEVGNVNASTVAVTFSVDVSASDYAAGVTIKVNGSAATISSATRQSNHAVVYYVLSAAVVFGNTVTWEYSGGNITNEATGAAMQMESAQSVANNVAQDIGAALRADAIAYWTMDEANGTRLDSTDHGNNLTENFSISQIGRVLGKVNYAANLTGSLQYFSHVSNSDLNVQGTSYTFTIWLRLNDKSTDYTAIQKYNSVTFEEPYALSAYSKIADDIEFYISDGDNYPTAIAVDIGSPSIDTWYFIVAWYDRDANTINIQVNNGQVNSDTAGSVIPLDNPDVFSIGSWIGGGFLNGAIDDTGFWKRVLTSDERTYLYNSGAGRALFPAP